MASTFVTPDQDAVVSEIYIAASPERVFGSLIDPKQVMQWWTSPQVQIEAFALEPRKGGRWTYDTRPTTMNVNNVSKFHCEGEVLEFDPPRTLAYTWVANWHRDTSRRTVVRWELKADGDGTRLRVTHSGLTEEADARRSYSGGWTGVVESIKKFLEG
jgi:uncharacterized protein YndB with AHSA1/START domain